MAPSRPGRLAFASLAFAIAFLARPTLAADTSPLPWLEDLEQARKLARDSKSELWIQFTGPWCHNCQRMERETFEHPLLTRLVSGRAVRVRLRSDMHEELALAYGFSALPATVILGPDGSILARSQGYRERDSFLEFLRTALSEPAPGRSRSLASQTSSSGCSPPAMEGYCPVTLVERHRLARGLAEFALVHEGRTFHFASAGAARSFRAHPEWYAPMLGGHCPVVRVEQGQPRIGSPRFGVLYQGHLFLCADDQQRRRFLQGPERYMQAVESERSLCVHCAGLALVLDAPPPGRSEARGPWVGFVRAPRPELAIRSSKPTRR